MSPSTTPELGELAERWWITDRTAVDPLEGAAEMLETGIKVIDLLTPYKGAGRSACSVAPAWARRC